MALPPHLADLENRLASRLEEAIAGFRHAFEERLRAASSQLLSSATEVPSPALDTLLAGFETETLEAAPRRAGAEAALAELLAAARAMDRGATQGEVLAALLDAARKSADRVALLLTREDGVEVWSASGFDESDAGGRRAEWSDALRQSLLATRGALRLDAKGAAEVTTALRLSPSGCAVVAPLVLRDSVAALLWADRRDGAPALAPFQLLAHLAAQRLELQAISERDATPTLYESPLTPGDELPLWSAAAVEAAPAPEIEEPAEEAGTSLWAAPSETAPAIAVEAEPEISAVTSTSSEVIEEFFEVESAPEPPPAVFEPLAPAAPAPPPDFTLETAAAPAEEEWIPEPEPEPTPAPAPPPLAAPVEAPDDLLGTVRMTLPSFAAPLARPTDESTAPFRIEPPVAPPSAAATHEFPLPSPLPAPPPDVADIDVSDEATVHTLQRPPIPPPPPPLPAMAPPPAPPPAPVEDPLDRTSSRAARTTEVAPPPDVQGPGLAFMAGRSARSSQEQPQHEEARRLARLLISEIKLYNEEQVLEGRRNRDLYHRLKEDIDRSRQIYEERVDAGVRSASDYFQQELVRSLAGGDSRALGI